MSNSATKPRLSDFSIDVILDHVYRLHEIDPIHRSTFEQQLLDLVIKYDRASPLVRCGDCDGEGWECSGRSKRCETHDHQQRCPSAVTCQSCNGQKAVLR